MWEAALLTLRRQQGNQFLIHKMRKHDNQEFKLGWQALPHPWWPWACNSPNKMLNVCERNDQDLVVENWPRAPDWIAILRRGQMRRNRPNIQILDVSGMPPEDVVHRECPGVICLPRQINPPSFPPSLKEELEQWHFQATAVLSFELDYVNPVIVDKADPNFRWPWGVNPYWESVSQVWHYLIHSTMHLDNLLLLCDFEFVCFRFVSSRNKVWYLFTGFYQNFILSGVNVCKEINAEDLSREKNWTAGQPQPDSGQSHPCSGAQNTPECPSKG